MIIGIGHDLVDISRIDRALERHGYRFLQRVFTEEERRAAQQKTSHDALIGFLAKRWAAKEACAKALGTGFRDGLFMRDIGVVSNDIGRPLLDLTGGALQRLGMVLPQGMRAQLHLSLSDEPPLASAYVMIEACQSDGEIR